MSIPLLAASSGRRAEENALCLLFTAGEKVSYSEMKLHFFLMIYDTELEREIDRSRKTLEGCR